MDVSTPMRLVITLGALLLCAGAAPEGPNPAAPRETSQFGFLIGTWDCTTRFRQADGAWREGTATWTGYYILGGWAIQDDWVSPRPDGGVFHGTNIRSFNPRTKKWDNRWLPQGSLEWKHFEAEKVGDTMVMLGKGEDARGPFLDRNTFYDIRPDGWRWRKDRSYDGGESWLEAGHIEARRRGAARPGGAAGMAPRFR